MGIVWGEWLGNYTETDGNGDNLYCTAHVLALYEIMLNPLVNRPVFS